MTVVDDNAVEVSVDIAAPMETVWEYVSDINLSARFQGEFRGAEWLGEARGRGAAFVGRNERKGYSWETTSFVIVHDPPRAFGWAVDSIDEPGSTWTFHLDGIEGGTRLRYVRVIGPGPSGLRSAIERHPDREAEIVARRNAEHVANMQQVVDGVKGLAEGTIG